MSNHFKCLFLIVCLQPSYLRYMIFAGVTKRYYNINPIKLTKAMSNHNDASLLGFLQKKSLFANTPTTNSRKRSRSRSKDSKHLDMKSNKNNF